jgi:ABC-type nitrate/sulfonate/bicarbonate transport system permease component
MTADSGSRLRLIANLIVILIIWEIAGLFDLVARGALPAPSEIAVQFWKDRSVYPRHVGETLWAAGLGFIIGNAIAIAAAVIFVLVPLVERLTRGISITLFAIPAIALTPILVIAFQGSTPRIVLAAVSVYFPTMIAMLVGLRQIDPRLTDVIRAYAGGRWQLLLRVRLRSSLPALLGGLRVAAPAAVLGAILAEFGGGVRWGLGTYLLGSLGQANPARLWGIGLTATLLAALAYGVFAWLAVRLTGTTQAVTIAAGASPENLARQGRESWLRKLLLGLLSVAIALGAWWLILWLLQLSPVVARSPLGVVQYLWFEPNSADARARLLAALATTLPLALIGLAIGLTFAFGFAVLSTVWRGLGQALLPFALITQTMPLVALTPLIVLIFGRGVTATLVITVSVTFFPAFVTIAQGLALTPKSAIDVLSAYGASRIKQLRFVSVPAALPYLFAAARLAAPRALLGVMIAEWLATGFGLGNLLNESRGRLDYGMIWAVAAVSVIVAIGFYQLTAMAERRVLQRFGMTHN